MKVVFVDDNPELNRIYENVGIIKHNLSGYECKAVVNIVINGYIVTSITANDVYKIILNDKDIDDTYIELYKQHNFDKPSKVSIDNNSKVYIKSSSLGYTIHVYNSIPKRGEGLCKPETF